jgi:hypothetical protein
MARQDGGHEPSDEEVDRAFADLVSGLGDRPTPWPMQVRRAGPDADTGARDDLREGPDVVDDPPTTVGGPRDYAPPEEPDEGFQPPEPAPLGGGNPLVTVAWCLAVGGPVLTVLVLVLWPSAPRLVWAGTLLAALAGIAVLVWRMPRRRDPDDHDDGAVV